MSLRIVEFVIGLLLSLATLRDVFYTVIVPGSSRGLLRVSQRLVHIALPIWKQVERRGIGVNFAPVVLVGSFATWMLLLVLGFGLMAHAMANSFQPPLDGFGHALYVAGGSMTTIGFGHAEALGPARALAVAAGFCGLAVMTLAVTYLLEVQSNIAHRDIGVLKITTTSGQPPCALVLLERYAALGCRDDLPGVLSGGRDWCATVLQSHASHPWLVYFRSVGTGSGWPSALGTLMDVALIAEHLIEEPGLRAHAVLTREEAHRLATNLADQINAQRVASATPREAGEELVARLAAAGYTMRPQRNVQQFLEIRDRHVAAITALAHHLGAPEAPLLPRGEEASARPAPQ